MCACRCCAPRNIAPPKTPWIRCVRSNADPVGTVLVESQLWHDSSNNVVCEATGSFESEAAESLVRVPRAEARGANDEPSTDKRRRRSP